MKIYIILFFFTLVNNIAYSQSDSIRRYANIQPLFKLIDSVARSIEQKGQSIDLVFCSFGRSLHRGIILWRSGKKYCGTYFQKVEEGDLKKGNIPQRKIKRILSSRLFSDSCDFCELLSSEKKADIDHEYNMYLKCYTSSKCNEIYFTSSAYLFYGVENCIYDVRQLLLYK